MTKGRELSDFPIQWHEWGARAFARAQAEDKPVMLRITASWCRWCEVMDATSDADPASTRMVSQHFIPVRIDSDRRPDLNDRYNLGGWPTTVFLTPAGDLITGGTYLPPEQYKEVLAQVAEAWQSDRAKVEQAIADRTRQAAATKTGATPSLSREVVERVIAAALGAFDRRYGGFVGEPKFLHPTALALLLEEGAATERRELSEAVLESLRKMRQAGLADGRAFGVYDHVAGGFFRYSTTPDWLVPSFEKMLEANARMLDLYVTAYQVTGDGMLLDTVGGILNFCDEWLFDGVRGAFCGSQGGGGEDRYYGLPAGERARVSPPPVDRTVFTNWNAQMISAHLKAGAVLSESPVLEAAHRALDFLRENCRADDGGMSHYFDGAPQGAGLLTDQVHMSAALLDAFEHSGERKYLAEATGLIQYLNDNLLTDAGVYRDCKRDPNALGLLRVERYPLAENSTAAQVLLRLHAITEEDEFRQRAVRLLEYFLDDFERYGLAASVYATAVSRSLAEPIHVRVVGSLQDAQTRQLHHAALIAFCPGRAIELLDRDQHRERIAYFAYPADQARAFLCRGPACLPPIEEANLLTSQLAEFARRG